MPGRYEVLRTQDPLETHHLVDHETRASVVVAPARGGMVTRFVVGDSNVLYLDPESLADPTKNVRGGIPVLFPIAGRLAGDSYSWRGETHTMKQHGFARNMPWAIVDQADEGCARLGLALTPNPMTRAQYPFEFRLAMTYVLEAGRLSVETRISNLGDAPMPIQPGLHPYFHLAQSDKAAARVLTDATEAFDNRTGDVVRLRAPIDLAAAEGVDLHLLDHWPRTTRLTRPGERDVELSLGVPDRLLVVWTERGKDFVCVEPWTARANAFNTGGALEVAPGGVHASTFTIAVV